MARPGNELPHLMIRRFTMERASYTDGAILDELAAFEVLPPENEGECWGIGAPAWDRAMLLLALGDVVASRRLKAGVPLVLAAASFGDPGETMRGLRHGFEATYAPDWAELAAVCERASYSDRRGARLWATTQLGVLREGSSFAHLVARLGDAEQAIREEAAMSLSMLCQVHTHLEHDSRAAIQAALGAHPGDSYSGW